MAKRQPVKPVGESDPQPEKNKGGRPTKYSDELADKICHIIATTEKGIHAICEEFEDMPCPATIWNWLNANKRFLDNYAQAKEIQMHLMGEKIVSIADNSSGDEMTTPNGNIVENREFMNRSKLRIETRMWLMERFAPKRFGKLSQEADPANKQAESYQPPQITVNISKEAIDKLNNK